MPTGNFVPYCGNPPIPGSLSWNTDPVIASVLLVGLGLYLLNSSNGRQRPSRSQTIFFLAGWTILAASLISPLCNLSVALFAARTAQHLAITLIAAPLLVLGRGGLVLRAIAPQLSPISAGGSVRKSVLLFAPLLFAVTLWFWHIPRFYDATLQNNSVYWTMHISLFAAAVGLWSSLFDTNPKHQGWNLTASLLTGMQTCALGAILTLAPRPWFSVHALTTWAWGLSPTADQQLGGVLMWVVGGILLGGFTMVLFARIICDRTVISVAAAQISEHASA